VCEACQEGKKTKTSFKLKNFVSTKRLLELLYMDLFGPSKIISLRGNYYTLVIVNDYSRFTSTLFMFPRMMSFKKLSKLLEIEINCCISSIKSKRSISK